MDGVRELQTDDFGAGKVSPCVDLRDDACGCEATPQSTPHDLKPSAGKHHSVWYMCMINLPHFTVLPDLGSMLTTAVAMRTELPLLSAMLLHKSKHSTCMLEESRKDVVDGIVVASGGQETEDRQPIVRRCLLRALQFGSYNMATAIF